ncbi:MAG: hypothetical protein IPH71_07205 [Proteobacteria bacterium]|nr:hypothetical protein [Pseudomonadota bacterium]
MIILVADTSVLIDLERGHLLQKALAGPDTIATPDLLYEKELAEYNGPELLQLGLQLLELTAAELGQVQTLRSRIPKLSIPDCAAYVGALRDDHVLLAGDGMLRQHATAKNVDHHGVLWLMDRILASGTATRRELHEGLTTISVHPRCRLPINEVAARLAAWR